VVIGKRPKTVLALGFVVALVGMIGAWYVQFNAEFKDGFNAVYVENWQGFSADERARMDQQFTAFVIFAVAGFCLATVATYILFRKSRSRVPNGKNQ
jgi:hypothetical protein